MKITVVEKDRENARRCRPIDCLLAQAIKREFGIDEVLVALSTAAVRGQWYSLCTEAIRLRNDFDDGHPVTLPQEIELTPL